MSMAVHSAVRCVQLRVHDRQRRKRRVAQPCVHVRALSPRTVLCRKHSSVYTPSAIGAQCLATVSAQLRRT